MLLNLDSVILVTMFLTLTRVILGLSLPGVPVEMTLEVALGLASGLALQECKADLAYGLPAESMASVLGRRRGYCGCKMY
jgi:hypothetical protein